MYILDINYFLHYFSSYLAPLMLSTFCGPGKASSYLYIHTYICWTLFALIAFLTVAVWALWRLHNAILQCVTVHRVPKFMSCHNAIMVVTRREHCSTVCIYTYIYTVGFCVRLFVGVYNSVYITYLSNAVWLWSVGTNLAKNYNLIYTSKLTFT